MPDGWLRRGLGDASRTAAGCSTATAPRSARTCWSPTQHCRRDCSGSRSRDRSERREGAGLRRDGGVHEPGRAGQPGEDHRPHLRPGRETRGPRPPGGRCRRSSYPRPRRRAVRQAVLSTRAADAAGRSRPGWSAWPSAAPTSPGSRSRTSTRRWPRSRTTPWLYVERGYQPDDATRILQLVLVVLGGVLMLGGTLTATFLALSDARPDLATLSAVGRLTADPPGGRRGVRPRGRARRRGAGRRRSGSSRASR